MRMFRSARWFLLTLLLSLIPASLHAQVVISVGFAPPELPVYEQPYCPEPNLMWMPGYWAYDQDQGGYYWVPGAWVPAPYEGALWTPDYWDWSGGHYRFHHGYWGHHVGYYGGVDYGFGYGGVGFAGGEWQGNEFRYNTAVTRVNESVIHSTYNDRSIVEKDTIANPGHVSFSGGKGGINHPPTAEERVAEHDQHTAPTSFQTQHVTAAKADKTSYAKANGGHPAHAVAAKPLSEEKHAAPSGVKTEAKTPAKAEPKAEAKPKAEPKSEAKPKAEPKTEAKPKAEPKAEAKPKAEPKSEAKPKAEPKAEAKPKAEPKAAPRAEPKAAPKAESKPESRPAPAQHAAPAPHPAAAAAPKAAPKPEEKQK
jgi:hypothetical protein